MTGLTQTAADAADPAFAAVVPTWDKLALVGFESLKSYQGADGNTAIWSIGALQEGAEEREHVLTIALDIKSRTVTQARGRYNAVPNQTAEVREGSQRGTGRLLAFVGPLRAHHARMDAARALAPRRLTSFSRRHFSTPNPRVRAAADSVRPDERATAA